MAQTQSRTRTKAKKTSPKDEFIRSLRKDVSDLWRVFKDASTIAFWVAVGIYGATNGWWL